LSLSPVRSSTSSIQTAALKCVHAGCRSRACRSACIAWGSGRCGGSATTTSSTLVHESS
jgi:hypothetical protein